MNGFNDNIETVTLTAEMVINAFSMARQEVYAMIERTANKARTYRIVAGGTVVQVVD